MASASALSRSCTPGSFSTERPARFTMPKAVNAARLRPLPFEERRVGRIGAGIAALDIVDAELVEHPRDEDLVLQREVEARRLLAVAQSRVEEVEAFLHPRSPAGGQTSVSWSGCWWLVALIRS